MICKFCRTNTGALWKDNEGRWYHWECLNRKPLDKRDASFFSKLSVTPTIPGIKI